jgi:hypothetical protein
MGDDIINLVGIFSAQVFRLADVGKNSGIEWKLQARSVTQIDSGRLTGNVRYEHERPSSA